MSDKPSSNFGLTIEERLCPATAAYYALRNNIMQSLRVAVPAVVRAFTPGPPASVSVEIVTNELVQRSLGGVEPFTESVRLPLLEDVPVVMPGAGGYILTFPIQPGDECLLVFSDTPLDAWWEQGPPSQGVSNELISARRHSLSDAIAIFGLRSKPRGLADYSTTSAQLRNEDGSVVVDIAASKLTVTAPSVEVNCSGEAKIESASAKVTCSGTVQIQGGSVKLGSAVKSRDFLLHVHPVSGASTGPVT